MVIEIIKQARRVHHIADFTLAEIAPFIALTQHIANLVANAQRYAKREAIAARLVKVFISTSPLGFRSRASTPTAPPPIERPT